MKKYIYLILILLLCMGAAPTRQATYTTGDTILADDVTSNEDAIFNYLVAGVDSFKDGSIVNADVSNTANIQAEKLNLTAINQSVLNTGTFKNTGAVTITGDTTIVGKLATSGGTNLLVGVTTFSSTLIAESTTGIGWTVQSSANQACNTTCTYGCVFGQDTATYAIVDCNTAGADLCVCAGSN